MTREHGPVKAFTARTFTKRKQANMKTTYVLCVVKTNLFFINKQFEALSKVVRQRSVRVILKTSKGELMGFTSRVKSCICVNLLVRLDRDVCKQRKQSQLLSDFFMVEKHQLALSIVNPSSSKLV